MTTRDSTINQYPSLMEKQKAMSQALLYLSGNGKSEERGNRCTLGANSYAENTHIFS